MKPLAAKEVVSLYFLEARAKLLDLAAILDRLDRGGESAQASTQGSNLDVNMAKIQKGLEILEKDGPGRAEAIQKLFSLDYDAKWERPTPRF